MGGSVRCLATVTSAALALTACSGGASERIATPATTEPGVTVTEPVDVDIAFNPPATPSWRAAAEHELELVREMRDELGAAAVFGADGPELLTEWAEAETEFGEAALPALAADLGFAPDALAALAAPSVQGFAGRVRSGLLGDVAVTGTMSLGMLAMAVDRADVSQAMTRVERTENYRRQVGQLSEAIRITSTLGLQTGRGRMRGEVRIRSQSTVTDAAGTTVGTMTGTAEGSFEALVCPGPDGIADGRYQLTLEQTSAHGGPASASTRRIDAPFTFTADDAAKLVAARFTANVDAEGRAGDGRAWNASVVVPIAILGPAEGAPSERSQNATADQVRATAGAALLPYVAIALAADSAERFWRSGKCVDLVPSVQSRKVDPGEVVAFEVDAKHRFDGAAIDRPITASSTGVGTIDPSGKPVDPPAKFTFTAGSERGDKGTIALEQRSRRGIGKTTLEFEVEERAVVVSITAKADWTPGGGVEAHGRMTLPATEVASVGLDHRTDASADYSETFVVALGLGSCEADYAAAIPVVLGVEQDPPDSETYRVRLDLSDRAVGDTATCTALGASVDVPVNAELFLVAWTDALANGVSVELGQTASVAGTDASGQIPYSIEVTVQAPES